jgi:magnesium chelatase family protein
VGGKSFQASEWRQRPFRSPHHSCSSAALIGGGSVPMPGEISLAHNGVLFLDELSEFDREALECLREPMENGHVSIARAGHHTDYPARFQLIAAMNPCPCGYLGEVAGQCRCTVGQIQRYQARISGPLLDRLDLHVRMESVEPVQLLRSAETAESSAAVAARILTAWEIQTERQQMCNANLDNAGVDRVCNPTPEGAHVLERALQRFRLSVRAYHRVLKVARTVADLEGAEQIAAAHISEALLFRQSESLNFCISGDRSYAPKDSVAL